MCIFYVCIPMNFHKYTTPITAQKTEHCSEAFLVTPSCSVPLCSALSWPHWAQSCAFSLSNGNYTVCSCGHIHLKMRR